MQRSYEHAHKLFVNNLSRQLIRTPSSLDNFDPGTEANCRVAACEFISDLSNCLQLPKWVTCTAQMSLHQYYDVESVKTSDRMIISISALFVACKVHDRARSADTFVRAAWDVLCTAALKSDMEKNRELARLNDPELVNNLVSGVLAGERAIFYALNFDLQPYKVHDLVMELSDGGLDKSFCSSPQGRNLFKTAWETVVFGAYSHLTQQFSQLEIAWGHVVLAARLLGYSQHLFREDGQGYWVSQGLSFTNGELELLVNMISAPFIAAADFQPPAPAGLPPGQAHARAPFAAAPAGPAHSPPHGAPPLGASHRQLSGGYHTAVSPPRHTPQHSPPHPAAVSAAAPHAGVQGFVRDHRQHMHSHGAARPPSMPPPAPAGAAGMPPVHPPRAPGEPPFQHGAPMRGVASAAHRERHSGGAADGSVAPHSGLTAGPARAVSPPRAPAEPRHGSLPRSEGGVPVRGDADTHAAHALPHGGSVDAAGRQGDAAGPPSPDAPLVDSFVPAEGGVGAADFDMGDMHPA